MPYPSGLSFNASTTFPMACGLYDAAQRLRTSRCASSMVIFKGVCAIANGINSCQCFGRVSLPQLLTFYTAQGRHQSENR